MSSLTVRQNIKWYRCRCYTLFDSITAQHRRHFRALQFNRLSFCFSFTDQICPSIQYICSLCSLHLHAQCDLCRMPSASTPTLSAAKSVCAMCVCVFLIVWLCIQCSFFWMMERAKRTNNLLSFNVCWVYLWSIFFITFLSPLSLVSCQFRTYLSSCYFQFSEPIPNEKSSFVFVSQSLQWFKKNLCVDLEFIKRATSSGKCLLVGFLHLWILLGLSKNLFRFCFHCTPDNLSRAMTNNTNWF